MTDDKAYVFFYCPASAEDINAALPSIREQAETPSDLELQLIEGMENVNGSQELKDIAAQAKELGMRCAFSAYIPGKTVSKAADELNTLLNYAYTTPLFSNGGKNSGTVFLVENGKVTFANDIF